MGEEIGVDHSLSNIELYHSDFKEVIYHRTQFDWSNATVVFVSSTCYSAELMMEVASLSKKMENGTIIVTLTKKLDEK